MTEFARDPNVIFTTDLYMGISRMRENLSLVFSPEFEASELEYLGDVIYELCEELCAELLNYSHEMRVLHEMDILYWRRRTIFQNENISSIREFLVHQFYDSLPTYPTHCINLVLVHDLHHLTPYFYLKRPVPSLQVTHSMQSLLDRKKVNKDDIVYLILQSWFGAWRASKDPSTLPPINNSVHVDSSRLDALNCEGTLFVDVPKWAWHHLLAWYGITNCHLGLERVVTDGGVDLDVEVERTPEDMWCFLFPNTNEFRIIRVSNGENLSDITLKIKRIYNIPAGKEAQLYSRKIHYENWELLYELRKTSGNCICNIMLVVRKENGDWPVVKECDY